MQTPVLQIPVLQIVDKRDPSRVVNKMSAASASALLRVHTGLASGDDWSAAQALVRNAHQKGAWLRCHCSEQGPLLAPALLGDIYYVRRLTMRAEHTLDCPFRRALPVVGTDALSARRLRPEPGHFCRPLRCSTADEHYLDHLRHTRTERPIPVLARELWRIIELAGLNRLDTDEGKSSCSGLSSQLAMIRDVARQIRVSANVRLDEVLSTYPGDVARHSRWHKKALGLHQRFQTGEQPQALMIGLARSVLGRWLQTAAGQIDCAVDVAMLPSAQANPGPPYLFMLAGSIDHMLSRITPIRAFAQPIFSIDYLIPVESEAERQLLGAVMAFQRSAIRRFPSIKITVEKPLFDIETERSWVRPPLVLTVSNARTEREERFVVRSERLSPGGIDKLDDLLGRRLIVPGDVLTGDAADQAGWFVDAIYGAPACMHSRVSLARGEHAPRAP